MPEYIPRGRPFSAATVMKIALSPGARPSRPLVWRSFHLVCGIPEKSYSVEASAEIPMYLGSHQCSDQVYLIPLRPRPYRTTRTWAWGWLNGDIGVGQSWKSLTWCESLTLLSPSQNETSCQWQTPRSHPRSLPSWDTPLAMCLIIVHTCTYTFWMKFH